MIEIIGWQVEKQPKEHFLTLYHWIVELPQSDVRAENINCTKKIKELYEG